MLLRFGGGGNLSAGLIQFLQGRVAPEAQADRGARLAVIEPERPKHMARPARPAGAGAPQREGDSAKVGEQPRGVHAVASDVEVAVIALARAAVHRPALAECFL